MSRTADLEKEEPEFCGIVKPRASYTTMMMGHDRRLIMGPARGGEVYSVVALVPDGKSGNKERCDKK